MRETLQDFQGWEFILGSCENFTCAGAFDLCLAHQSDWSAIFSDFEQFFLFFRLFPYSLLKRFLVGSLGGLKL